MRWTYKEILELLLNKVLSFPVCRAIIRKSGIRTRVLEAVLLPPGGRKRQVLAKVGNNFFWADTVFRGFLEHDRDGTSRYDPNFGSYPEGQFPSTTGATITGTDAGVAGTEADWSKTAPNQLGLGPRRIIHFGNLRNPVAPSPDYYQQMAANNPGLGDDYFHLSDATKRMQPIGNHRARQFFIWENIPAGYWYYPMNLHHFNKRVDFSAAITMDVHQTVRVGACVVEGNPDAELVLVYSTASRLGPWTQLAAVDLAPGGPVRGNKNQLPDGAKADVWVCLQLHARSTVAKLHLSYATAWAEWLLPIDYWQPYENRVS